MGRANGSKMNPIKNQINMQASITMIKSMVKANLIGRVAIIMWVLIKMIKDMGMEKCTGQMALSTKEIGSKAFNTASDRLNYQTDP